MFCFFIMTHFLTDATHTPERRPKNTRPICLQCVSWPLDATKSYTIGLWAFNSMTVNSNPSVHIYNSGPWVKVVSTYCPVLIIILWKFVIVLLLFLKCLFRWFCLLPSSRMSSAQKFGGSDKCARCGKVVYFNERVIAAGRVRLKTQHTWVRFNMTGQMLAWIIMFSSFFNSHGIREDVSAVLSAIRALTQPH